MRTKRERHFTGGLQEKNVLSFKDLNHIDMNGIDG
jgi:hypothetical protein